MRRKGFKWRSVASLGMSLALLAGAPVATGISANGLAKVQAAPAVTRESIHDGTILHAFCWNFNTIKENIPEIAAAGYTAVQTSPINECLATHPGMAMFGDTEDDGRWYYHYQPTDWKIGNYQLGTRAEFKAMCDEAEKYGIGIIVDIAPNHTTPLYDQVSEDLKNAAGGEDSLYHLGAKVENGDQGGMKYDNRISVTYDAMGGLPDVDTENPGFQNYFYEFLEDCIDCGADGFRIDTAKHIALPDDKVPDEYAGQEDRNNFYSNMKDTLDAYGSKDYADLFVYGEVLDGDASRVAAYQDMLGGTCASNYGGSIRNAVSSGNVSAKSLQSYKINDDSSMGTTYKADSDKLVTWVESHDNYINDKSYDEIDDRDVVLGWAIIAARKSGTPLFFSRPDGSSQENPWGNNLMGVAGSDIYKAPEVVAVNKFRTAMEHEDENLRNPGNNSSVLMIERGSKGVVIVNASENDYTLDSETALMDGNYLDSVEGRETIYNVADGRISGKIPAQSVVVLYEEAEGDYSTLFFHNTDGWSSVTCDVDGTIYSCEDQGYSWWKVTIPEKAFKVKFTGDGNESATFKISETSGKFMTAKSSKLYSSKAEAEDNLGIVTKTVYFLNNEEWKTVNAYAWLEDGTQLLGGWPGKACESDEGYWVRATVKMVGDESFSIIFSGSTGQTVDIKMDDMSKNYIVIADDQDGNNLSVNKYTSKSEAEEATGIGEDSITVHYYNAADWDKVGVYTWGDIELGSWPGAECEYEGDGWWKKTIDASPSSNLNIIFNNMPSGDDDKRQTEDMRADSLKKVYFVGAKYKFGSRKEAEEFTKDPEFVLEKGLAPAPSEDLENWVKPIGEEEADEEGFTKIYIKLDTAVYSSDANLYVWTEGDKNNEYMGGWPGKAMTHIGNGWHSVNVPEEMMNPDDADLLFVDGVHLITNNGNGAQDDDVNESFTTTRPSEEELNQEENKTEPETSENKEEVNASAPEAKPAESTPIENTPAEVKPETQENNTSGSASNSSSDNSSSSDSSSSSTSTSAASPKSADSTTTISDAQTPKAAVEIKVADNTLAQQSQGTGRTAQNKKTEEITVTEEKAEVTDEDVIEAAGEVEVDSAAEIASSETPDEKATTSIEDEAVPEAISEGGINPMIIVGIAIAVLAISALGLYSLKNRTEK